MKVSCQYDESKAIINGNNNDNNGEINYQEIFNKGICLEWIQIFFKFEDANTKNWLMHNKNGKIHEYQIQV